MKALGKLRRLAWIPLLGWVLSGQLPAQIVANTTADTAAASPILPAIPPGQTRIFPLAEVRRGLEGVAYTVFEGVTPEPMRVEILGLLKNALGPGQDMILARLHGEKPEYTGVVAGMSGSPVYVNGRLVGALSYRIGQFSKEPIAGITPIEQMLEVRHEPVREVASTKASDNSSPEIKPMETPLVFSGFTQDTLDHFGDRFRAMGLTPVAGLGGSDSTTPQPEPLVPGSAVSAILVRGDLSIAGTCTVTYVDPSKLLACGHPITQYGTVDMPMTKASVVATLPSPLNAFKIVNTTETVGAFTEDRSSAIMGQFGIKSRMIPVTVEVASASNAEKAKTFHFEVLDNRELTPSAMLVSIYQSLQGTNSAAVRMSYQLSGEIGIAGQQAVKLHGLLAQNELNPASINAALFVTDLFSRIYGNPLEQPTITGLTLKAERIPERRTAVIESAQLSQTEVRPGQTVEIEVALHPYQAEPQLIRIPIKLPENLSPGTMRLLVSDGAAIDKLLQPSTGASQRAVGLADTIGQLNNLHANDRVHITLLDRAAQVLLENEALPDVPLSMANVLSPLRDAQRMQLTGESAIAVGSADTQYAVSGSRVLSLTVR